ncbi:unnamed protein product [Adineta ricciae]|uniref:G-protein coupled receptors family 1 profile domain-containing protein n=1 Tax=Adineta ricciae TaxID=249248 RepID=A0A815N601_ADIRI|nr:unnamed protein product [Adineta ricciae]
MTSLTRTATNLSASSTNYDTVAPISMAFALVAIVISVLILTLIISTKQLHTVSHLLTCNTCIASILYCIVQCNNYIYLLFIKWNMSDESCRWRGYFGYTSIVAVIYSYLLQAISRLFFTILSTKYRWIVSFRVHLYLIFIGWIVVFLVPLPAITTKDIYYRQGFLCWVPKRFMLHVIYTIIMYYLLPIVLIIVIYILIYKQVHSHANKNSIVLDQTKRKNLDLTVFRKIMILLSIYVLGAVPSLFYMLTNVELFYSIGIVSVSFTVMIERFLSLLIDRDIRDVLKKCLFFRTNQVTPIAPK